MSAFARFDLSAVPEADEDHSADTLATLATLAGGGRASDELEKPANGPPDWDEKSAALISWFETTTPPAKPFNLFKHVTVANPARYWAYLRADIVAGPKAGQGFMGALAKDLKRLAKLFGGPRAA